VALQDLTPQLRTRLSRLERVVGVFVAFAALLLVGGLAYYLYQRAQVKGWWKVKLPYYTYVHTGAGLKVGDPVQLMGRDVGRITAIEPMPPGDPFDVFVAFSITEPDFGYLWEDSRAKVAASDFLGKRMIEVSKGTNGPATYIFYQIRDWTLEDAASISETNQLFFAEEIYGAGPDKTNLIVKVNEHFTRETLDRITAARSITSFLLFDKGIVNTQPTGLWKPQAGRYFPPNHDAETRKGYFLVPDESPAVTERLEQAVSLVEAALPAVLDLTNQLRRVLDNAVTTTSHADEILVNAKPIVANLTRITENISEPDGSLGTWLFPPGLSLQLTQALASAQSLLTNSDAQLTALAGGLDVTIENLANLTSNLHAQVKANTNLVSDVSRLIIDTDDMVQGLKRHWLLRSAFKKKPAETPATAPKRTPARSPRDGGRLP
jgi:ABC-type transporter Mla subunit MlaD